MSNTIKALAITAMIASTLITGCANMPESLSNGVKSTTDGLLNGSSPSDIANAEAQKAKDSANKSANDSINNIFK